MLGVGTDVGGQRCPSCRPGTWPSLGSSCCAPSSTAQCPASSTLTCFCLRSAPHDTVHCTTEPDSAASHCIAFASSFRFRSLPEIFSRFLHDSPTYIASAFVSQYLVRSGVVPVNQAIPPSPTPALTVVIASFPQSLSPCNRPTTHIA